MNLSIFENDQTFGDTGETRVVVLSGTTTVSGFFDPNVLDVFSWARDNLVNAGFSVIAFRASPIWGLELSKASIEIELNVDLAYTAEQARQSAISVIEAVTANYGFNKVFSNTTLNVVSDQQAAASGGQLPTGSSGSNPPSQYNQPGVQSITPGVNFWSSAGLTTPIALVAGGIVLLMILKR